MIVGIGTDIAETDRIKKSIDQYGKRFLKKVFSKTEIDYCESNAEKYTRYSARFAAKEAFSKAVGSGIGGDFVFNEISIENLENGKPKLILYGKMKEIYGMYKIHVSLSHTSDTSIAFVIIED
ncbi:MAG: holo-ACP synthase [Candidatus Kapabacteria bacterium]|jgi:holo-[acyl-carrier protein] synthase|nr:holo-ACP synthase [Candidatus Kapabacteria bacterium]